MKGVRMARETPVKSGQLRVGLVARREPGVTGTSRYAARLLADLPTTEVAVSPGWPRGVPGPLARAGQNLGVDLGTFFGHYPYRLAATDRDDCDIYHLTTQNLATLLLVHRFHKPVVVTVHDIIPYLVRGNRHLTSYAHPLHRLFDTLAMHGLKRADLLLADSAWTRGTLIQHLGISGDRVRVVYLGVDTARFRPREVPDTFWSRYGLERGNRHLLYVGSEDPRKNLATLLRAFALVSPEWPELRLLKVGAAHHPAEHDRLIELAESLGIAAKVRWLSTVGEEDLPLFYNAADLFVMPSYYEGFGLPVLEALACGTRVVSSNAAALPEVAGADCRLCPPTVEGIAEAMREALASRADAKDTATRVAWAQRFSWTRTAAEVREAYALTCRPGS
ncbi:MAG TPA: glycosyltransferase family 1 protein [Chloroflexota bacterium]|nr:glycosyltransferase family 1 protein [Chloroflexota bacterium]